MGTSNITFWENTEQWLLRDLEQSLKDAHERDYEVIRAASRLLCWEKVYAWPMADQVRLIELALDRLEDVKKLDIFQLVPTYGNGVEVEIGALRSRLEILRAEPKDA